MAFQITEELIFRLLNFWDLFSLLSLLEVNLKPLKIAYGKGATFFRNVMF